MKGKFRNGLSGEPAGEMPGEVLGLLRCHLGGGCQRSLAARQCEAGAIAEREDVIVV